MYNIRNFSIIAHVDHGKSTLSDRFIQLCGGLSEREMTHQVLDTMDLERERGITIKSQSVTLHYKSVNNKSYKLNLIDTPGHVDFSYEVSRSLSACEGALLVIDAGQGVEAQTLANFHVAMEMNLQIIPVINKIDLPNANPDKVNQEIRDFLGINPIKTVSCSAKTGHGVLEVLECLITYLSPPSGNPNAPLQALIIDSWFDNYLGIISLIRVKNGTLYKGDKIKMMSNNLVYKVERLGIFTPKRVDLHILQCGEVGWFSCSIKDILGAPVGDTVTLANNSAVKALPGLKKIKPQVYAGLFPIDSQKYKVFSDALCKLSLNDASLIYEPENSISLGPGFRCGFLGLLHMDIVQERLKREYNIDLITTAPTVLYKILTVDNNILYIDNPYKLPASNKIKEFSEPIAECYILLPKKYLGNVISMCMEKRGKQINMIYNSNNVLLIYELPLAEVIMDFFNRLKSISHGYASLDYKLKYFKLSNMVCLNILINGNKIDALSIITHKTNALYRSYNLITKLHNLIPRQQFDVVIQASVGKNIIARSVIKQLRKNVLSRCSGGDISRKKKLLQKQILGKKRMKNIGNVALPKEVFLAMLDINK